MFEINDVVIIDTSRAELLPCNYSTNDYSDTDEAGLTDLH